MKKVILVDDETFARKGLLALIPWSELGYEIVGEADDGEEAVKLIERLRPDVVVTDIRMPVMDGLKMIGAVREMIDSAPKFIIISGYSDFKYAQQAVRYGVQDFILKPIDEAEMSQTLRRIAEMLEKNREGQETARVELDAALLENWSSGAVNDEMAEANAELLDIRRDCEYCCILIERNNVGFGQEREPNALAEIAALKRSIHDAIALEQKATLFDIGPSVFGIVATTNAPGSRANDWEAFSARLLRSAPPEVRANVRVYAGKPGLGVAGIAESYRTAKEAVQYKYALDGQSVIMHNQATRISLRYKQSDAKLNAELTEAVEEGDEQAVRSTVDKLFESFRQERFAPESVQASIAQSVLGMTRVVRELEGNEQELHSLKAMMQWSQEPRTLSGLRSMFLSFAMESAAYIADRRKQRAKGAIQKVKQYIETHYHENMSLKHISKKFYMNPVYLGQLFKKTYGVYFNDYLLEIRIQEAKKLLRQTDLKVYEVAERVGFGNPDYFVTQFEKVERKTPTEYKNGLLTNN
ncbi:response regulator [Paenibacillaceae bacterium WGS1546]|uniref:response regulator n=1 Tax=Cohnella sp. WGS1546 TaxID=3366810 RepID=UPI00372D63A6